MSKSKRSLNRRRWLGLTGAAAAAAWLPGGARGAAPTLARAMAESDLLYLTPLLGGGSESACQAEVWFVADGGDAVVVTASDAWRATAVTRGFARARLWVGDVGVWSDANGAYRALPTTTATASFVTEADEHARLLDLFGDKYSLEWIIWGPRFRSGLKEGSRVMIRYRPG